MGTQFAEIYESVLTYTKDYDLLKHVEFNREEILTLHLKNAIRKFKKDCIQDLSQIDFENKEFLIDLADDAIDVLVSGCLFSWSTRHMNNTDNFINVLSTKYNSFFSPSNLLKELSALRATFKKEFRQNIIVYSFRNSNIQDLDGSNL